MIGLIEIRQDLTGQERKKTMHGQQERKVKEGFSEAAFCPRI